MSSAHTNIAGRLSTFIEGVGNEMSDDVKSALIDSLKRMGFDQEEAEQILAELIIINKGRLWGHAHLEDVPKVVHRALDWQHNRSITLKVSKEGYDDYDGHLEIEVVDIEKGR
jgi:hypothetical protein